MVPSVLPHVKSGRLRALGIGSEKRSSVLPEAPTISESGLAGYEADTWYGLLAPAATNTAGRAATQRRDTQSAADQRDT